MPFFTYLFAALAFCSLAYYFLCLLAAARFRSETICEKVGEPQPISILKPVKGCDPGMYESLRSHCMQDYPRLEIIFGVNDGADEAIPYIERLKTEFPNVPMRTVVSVEVLGANRKVSNLVQMLRVAKYDHVLINDGDIRVPANYLRDVMREFSDEKVGMVTCLYRGVAGKTVWSKLEAMGINVDFAAGVLVARFLEGGVRFALGSTMATTKAAVAAIGGLESLADYLADDYELGSRITAVGYRAVIAPPVVETLLSDYSFRDFIDHQLRWGRTVRSSRPVGYFGMVVTFGMWWAFIAVICDRNDPLPFAWLLLLGVIGGKALVTLSVGSWTIGDRKAVSNLWLLPLRELITPTIWLMSLFGNKIVWRGEIFKLQDGKLVR